MKTKNACFWIFLLLSGSAYAQMSQKGTVQIFNSNGTMAQNWKLLKISNVRVDLDTLAAQNKNNISDGTGISSSTSANRNREWLSLLRMYIRKDMNW